MKNISFSFLFLFILSLCPLYNSVVIAQSSTLTEVQLDNLWNNRHLPENEKQIAAYVSAKPAIPFQLSQQVRFFKMVFYYADYILTPKDKDLKLDIYDFGMKMAEEIKNKNPTVADGYYWFGLFCGMHGLTKGIVASLGGAKKMLQFLTESIKVDPSYSTYGAYMVRGRLYFMAPSMISFGDKDKALADYEVAIKNGCKNRLLYTYYAESMYKMKGKKEALEILQKAKNLEKTGGVKEEIRYDETIEALEKEWLK